MLAHMPERNLPFTACVVECQLDAFLTDFENKLVIDEQGDDVYQDVIACADWMGLCCDLNCAAPNTQSLYDMVCFKCGAAKQLLRTDYLEDPFKWHDEILTLADFPNSAITSLPLSARRYCFMHGISNLLSNMIKNMYHLLPLRSQAHNNFEGMMQTVSKHWQPTKALICKQMNDFFAQQLHIKLPLLFITAQHTYILTWPRTPTRFHLQTSQVVEMLLDSIHIYKQFAYTPTPNKHNFATLRVARDCIVSCHVLFAWRIMPTTHHLTNHAITDAEYDGTAYITLQEGVENNNQEVHKAGRVAFKGPYTACNHKSPYEYILDQEQIKLKLTQLG